MNRRSIRSNSFLALLTLPVYREALPDICDAPKATPVTRVHCENETPGLRLAAARAVLPGVPITKQFELLVEAGLLDKNIQFGARKPLAERFGAVGDSPGRHSGYHGVQFQLAHIDLVQRV